MSYSKSTIIYRTLAGLIFICICLLGALSFPVSQDGVTISFLDVGQGDAVFIQTPNRTQVLMDAGPKDVVMQKLKDEIPRGDTSIDLLVVTNPDADHISGFLSVLDEYTVSAVLVPNTRSTTATYKNLKKKIKEKNIPELVAYRGMEIVLDRGNSIHPDAVLSILFPDQVVKNWERNSGSIVSRFVYGDTSVMLMGDATSETEKIIIGDFFETGAIENLQSDILKLGHHGSRTSTSDMWLDVVKPDIAIVSAGLNNRYGHPHKEVIDTLADRGVEIRETSTEGTVTYVSDGKKWVEK